jgi:NitT/TauT family transport system ATP-binding protein
MTGTAKPPIRLARPGARDDPPARARATSIDIAGVNHSYERKGQHVVALEDIDLSIAPGEFVALLGPSGCGKSTLLLLVAGLMRATGGTVRIGDEEVTRPYVDLGFVFQDPTLLEWRTALRNILLQADVRKLDRDAARKRALELMESTNIAGFEDAYPNELSGGMRQRVAICRALLHDPPLLLMDEPFGALDALTREQMSGDLQSLWMSDPKTVLFVTHDISEAIFLADRVVVLSGRPGRVLGVVDVALPRPRRPEARDPRQLELELQVRDLLRADGVIKE